MERVPELESGYLTWQASTLPVMLYPRINTNERASCFIFIRVSNSNHYPFTFTICIILINSPA